jgi:shikimate kinase
MPADNLILIGMPGAGKSTVGALLAQQLRRPFVDTDVLIENAESASLQRIVDTRGQLTLRALEEKIICGLMLRGHVIATGGSVVYSAAAMAYLQQLGKLIYLQLDLPTLEQRVANFLQRGLARRADQSLADLYKERVPLYERYADIVINCGDKTPESICHAICQQIRSLAG